MASEEMSNVGDQHTNGDLTKTDESVSENNDQDSPQEPMATDSPKSGSGTFVFLDIALPDETAEKTEVSENNVDKSTSENHEIRSTGDENSDGSISQNYVSEEYLVCGRCEDKYKYLCDLNDHPIKRADKIQCQLCEFRCSWPSHLRKHMRIHAGEKPYACQECPCKFNQESRLRRHMACHSGARHFACRFCSYKTTRGGRLRKHLTTHVQKMVSEQV